MTRTVAPFGTWPSPITPEMLTVDVVRLADPAPWNGRTVWSEGRAAEGGRDVLVAADADGSAAEDLVPAPRSARTRVHEYGGRCWVACGDAVVASEWSDQRLWRYSPGAAPVALTPEPASPGSVRYADPVVSPDGRWIVAVRETHDAGDVTNDVVAIPTDGGAAQVVASGRDFYAAPAIAPDGERLAWVCWDHPQMPWDDTEIWVADLRGGASGNAGLVVGGAGESVQQPRWSPDGVLHWVSDRTGWWNLYAEGPDGGGRPLCTMAAEFGQPGWQFGVATYAFTSDGRLVASWAGPDGAGLGVVADGAATAWSLPWTSFAGLCADGTDVVVLAASPTEPWRVVRVAIDGSPTVVKASSNPAIDAAAVSVPERRSFPTAGGATAWALVYPPTSATHEAPPGELPPLVVMSHGGPTAAASSVFDLRVQWWTSRGFTVADVDYRGSTGYGRDYRNRLRGDWGVCDVEDCAAVARWLASEGLADPARCTIRGGSAGGYTTLAALAFTDVFAAGADHYGVADLEALAADTHKFESRYLDGMIGPWPDAAELYRARSPIHHLDGFDRPLVIFQGTEDLVVPPAQSEMIHRALRDRGVPVAYLPFEGEQHGFRRAATIQAVALAEVSFFGLVLGFRPDGAVEVEVDNLPAADR